MNCKDYWSYELIKFRFPHKGSLKNKKKYGDLGLENLLTLAIW